MAPFKSEAQRRYLWLHHPEIAERWAKKYGTPRKLPYHKKGSMVAEAIAERRKK